jgi:hypothetical protein
MAGFEMKHHLLATFGALLAVVHLLAQAPATGPFDLVIANGRVMDPSRTRTPFGTSVLPEASSTRSVGG